MTDIMDLNAALSKAIIQQFFEPIVTGRDANGNTYYAPSGVALMAQEIYKQQASKILDEVWERIDIEDLASKVATLVVGDLTRVPGPFASKNHHQEELIKRIREIVAQQLGQRVVDRMDIQLGNRELASSED